MYGVNIKIFFILSIHLKEKNIKKRQTYVFKENVEKNKCLFFEMHINKNFDSYYVI